MQDTPISRARYMQENRKMRFTEAYESWGQGRLTQAEVALLAKGLRRNASARSPAMRRPGIRLISRNTVRTSGASITCTMPLPSGMS